LFSRVTLVARSEWRLPEASWRLAMRTTTRASPSNVWGRTLGRWEARLRARVVTSIYPLSGSIGEQVRRIAPEFFDKAKPPAGAVLSFEGLPSLDASFAVDVIAITSTSQ